MGIVYEAADSRLGRRVALNLSDRAGALEALRKAWAAGFRDPDWARRDPDLASLRGDPEFERLYPETPAATVAKP